MNVVVKVGLIVVVLEVVVVYLCRYRYRAID